MHSDGQKIVGYYQYPDSSWERMGKTMANFGKFAVGTISLGITAAMPFCPPCAAAVSLLTISEFLVRLIPGADVVANIIAMANPLNFLECSTKWGFNGLDPTQSSEVDEQEFGTSMMGSFVGGGSKLYKSTILKDPDKLKRFEKWTKMGKSGAAMATFAYGVYENKVWETTFRQSTESEFRDTAAYEACLSSTWKDPTS